MQDFIETSLQQWGVPEERIAAAAAQHYVSCILKPVYDLIRLSCANRACCVARAPLQRWVGMGILHARKQFCAANDPTVLASQARQRRKMPRVFADWNTLQENADYLDDLMSESRLLPVP